MLLIFITTTNDIFSLYISSKYRWKYSIWASDFDIAQTLIINSDNKLTVKISISPGSDRYQYTEIMISYKND